MLEVIAKKTPLVIPNDKEGGGVYWTLYNVFARVWILNIYKEGEKEERGV